MYYIVMTLDLQSVPYNDNRAFLGGPFLYQFYISGKMISVVPNVIFPLNQWLADGLLVSSTSSSVAQVSEVDLTSSRTAATSFKL